MGGQHAYTHGRQDCYQKADGCLLFYDLTSRVTYKSLPRWYQEFRTVSQAPVVMCGSKVDCKDLKVTQKETIFPTTVQCQHFRVSAKSNTDFEKPFLSLLRQLMQKPDLQFVEAPAKLPPEIKI